MREKLKEMSSKAMRVTALGGALMAGSMMVNANTLPENNAQPRQEQRVSQAPHKEAPFQFKDKKEEALYDSLPDKYKAFAGKDFDTRMEMKEEMSQRSYRIRAKQHPHDKVAAGWDIDMYLEKLSIDQQNMVNDLVDLGRPISTVDTSLPLSEQMRSCGLDSVARVVEGADTYKDFHGNDAGRMVEQMTVAESLLRLPENGKASANLRRHCQECHDRFCDEQKGSFISRLFQKPTRIIEPGSPEWNSIPERQYQNINGTEIDKDPEGITDSARYNRDITLKVASKLEMEDRMRAARANGR